MTDRADFKDIQDMMQAFFTEAQLPAGVVVVPKDYQLASTEKFESFAKRFRGAFTTDLIEDFANYYARNVEADQLSHAPIFIDTQPLQAVALLDWMVADDRPGHLQHKAACIPQALPDWMALRRLHGQEMSQDEAVDLLEDFGGAITAYDDVGQGMAISQLIGAFRNTKITKQSEHAQSLEDARVERSALETIDANASRRAPGRLTFHIVPFEGFSTRSVLARVIIRARDNEPVFTFRIVGFETLEHDIAKEFVNLVQQAVAQFFSSDEAPAIYVGRFHS
jgi:uncharacterized protein YfdQ (DUF2303 family)